MVVLRGSTAAHEDCYRLKRDKETSQQSKFEGRLNIPPRKSPRIQELGGNVNWSVVCPAAILGGQDREGRTERCLKKQ